MFAYFQSFYTLSFVVPIFGSLDICLSQKSPLLFPELPSKLTLLPSTTVENEVIDLSCKM